MFCFHSIQGENYEWESCISKLTSLKIEFFFWKDWKRILSSIFTLFASSLNYHFPLFLVILLCNPHRWVLNSSFKCVLVCFSLNTIFVILSTVMSPPNLLGFSLFFSEPFLSVSQKSLLISLPLPSHSNTINPCSFSQWNVFYSCIIYFYSLFAMFMIRQM